MKMELGQVFYGRGERGYGVLGASPAGTGVAARVAALCGEVGTPDGGYAGEPFLLSTPDGENVLMACGRRGRPDSMGRGTLFFHVLVARASDLEAAGADAFSLFAQGAFVERMPGGEVANVLLDVRSANAHTGSGGVLLPAVIRSEKPAPETVRVLAGRRVNSLRWTACAFQPMPGFDIQVLPPRTAVPRGANEYDPEGRLVRAAAGGGADMRNAGNSRLVQPGGGRDGVLEPAENERSGGKGGGSMLKLSLFANVVLAVICIFLWAPWGTSPGSDARGRTSIERYRAELVAEFPVNGQIRDWDAEAAKAFEAWYKDILNYHPDTVSFLSRAKTYVDFVNEHILANTQPKDIQP